MLNEVRNSTTCSRRKSPHFAGFNQLSGYLSGSLAVSYPAKKRINSLVIFRPVMILQIFLLSLISHLLGTGDSQTIKFLLAGKLCMSPQILFIILCTFSRSRYLFHRQSEME